MAALARPALKRLARGRELATRVTVAVTPKAPRTSRSSSKNTSFTPEPARLRSSPDRRRGRLSVVGVGWRTAHDVVRRRQESGSRLAAYLHVEHVEATQHEVVRVRRLDHRTIPFSSRARG